MLSSKAGLDPLNPATASSRAPTVTGEEVSYEIIGIIVDIPLNETLDEDWPSQPPPCCASLARILVLSSGSFKPSPASTANVATLSSSTRDSLTNTLPSAASSPSKLGPRGVNSGFQPSNLLFSCLKTSRLIKDWSLIFICVPYENFALEVN